jgi:hypothetical protein
MSIVMEAILKEHLRRLADCFTAATSVPDTAIGSRALNHSKFFARLADADNSLTLKTYDRVVRWFSDNWPADAEWPEDIARPVNAEAAA